MSEIFYRIATGSGKGLKKVWDVAVGNDKMIKRGLTPNYSLQIATAGGIGLLSIFAGEVVALNTGNFWLWPAIIAGGAISAPLISHQTYATFKCGEDSMAKRLTDQRSGQKQLPAPKPDGLI
jgi:hypothetical protein